MTISDVIKNITEIQDPLWVLNLSEKELDKIEDQFWLIWTKLKLIKEQEIIEPLEKISKFLTANKILDGKPEIKRKNVDFKTFYLLCISTIPKGKYKFIYPKKKKKKDYDYEFLKLLSKDLNESVRNCEDYYDTYEGLGILETEKEKLFSKYGIEYQPKSKDVIQIVNISSIEEHPNRYKTNTRNKEYFILLEKMKAFDLIEPIIIEKKTNYIVSGYKRYLCCKELGKTKIPVIKKEFKFDVLKLINFQVEKGKLLSERFKEYQNLNKKIKNLGYKERGKIMRGLNLRDYLYEQTGISQTQAYRIEYIERKDANLYQKVLKNQISVTKAYSTLMKVKKT